jgi:hypothetical protein
LKVWDRGSTESADENETTEFTAWMRSYRDSCRWQAAKSSPPHEYTIRDWRPEADNDFDWAAGGIRECGYSQKFFQHEYTYFNLDGMKYWTMGNPLSETTVVNRDPIESQYE